MDGTARPPAFVDDGAQRTAAVLDAIAKMAVTFIAVALVIVGKIDSTRCSESRTSRGSIPRRPSRVEPNRLDRIWRGPSGSRDAPP